MAIAHKKEVKIAPGLTYEEMVKTIKSIKGSRSIIGDEIAEQCTVGKIRTGIPTIDYMGGGGVTEGRVTIFAGKPSSAKTTCLLQIISTIIEDMKSTGEMKFILYFDAEGGYDDKYAESLGIDRKYVIVKRTKVMEDSFEEADKLISMGFIKAVVFDSFDAMVPKKTDDNAYSNTMGSQSGAISAHLPSLYSKLIEHNCTCFIVKQARSVMGYTGGAEVITFNGGYALKHFSDTIFVVNRCSDRNLTYCPIKINARKTRSARMGRTLELPCGEFGIDKVRDLVWIAKAHALITVAGAGWTTYNDVKEQGEERFIAKLREDPELYKKLLDDVYTNIIDARGVVCESTTELIIDEEKD